MSSVAPRSLYLQPTLLDPLHLGLALLLRLVLVQRHALALLQNQILNIVIVVKEVTDCVNVHDKCIGGFSC